MLFVTPAVLIAVVIPVPPVVVIESAAFAVPIALVIHSIFMPRTHPSGASERRAGPVSVVPAVLVAVRVPIPVHPYVIGPRLLRLNPVGARGWWRAHSDAHGNLSAQGRRRQQHNRKKSFHRRHSYQTVSTSSAKASPQKSALCRRWICRRGIIHLRPVIFSQLLFSL